MGNVKQLEAELQRKKMELEALQGIIEAINSNMGEEELYRVYRFTLQGTLAIGNFGLYPQDNDWECKIAFNRQGIQENRRLDDRYKGESEIRFLDDNDPFSDLYDTLIPLHYNGSTHAIIFVKHINLLGKEGELDAVNQFIRTLSHVVIVAVENKRLILQELKQQQLKRELDLARKVQQRLFPAQLPDNENFRVESFYQPHSEVGGDYFDVVDDGKGGIFLCIADVSGKGMPAAIIMANFQASFRTLTRSTHSLKEIVQSLNILVKENAGGESFITFFVAHIMLERKEINYINCGHNPPYLIRKREITPLKSGTMLLGIMDPLPFINEAVIPISEPFRLFCFTDGLTEVFNEQDEIFDEENLEKFLMAHIGLAANQLHTDLIAHVDKFRANRPLGDDITMLTYDAKK
ncbi:MAG: serine/threonine-protein phosphatase [Cyclobacteriaceae bacterium]|nr:serine/threonine-protein phosphatase [Cyclobacteriaceae bacterium]MCH8514835.1 serine/threonine-protein phosphatase [Cyclobacteriaceae bacterium]